MFLFIGDKKALLMDTGATGDETAFPLFRVIDSILGKWKRLKGHELELIVAHTHSHGDHVAADVQFRGKSGTTVVGLSVDSVSSFFKINNWPLGTGSIDLGNRLIDIIPIPGHHRSSIAVYDGATRLLLTGDSFYPGRLYINDWKAFGASVQRLADFATRGKVSHILGNHIEMTNVPRKDYPVGTLFQPDEHRLPLTVRQLQSLNAALKDLGDTPTRKALDHFIIYPVKQ
jgi:glyoxylase-like metal-dependent hydrolase (beta-lactamase superfamily II)